MSDKTNPAVAEGNVPNALPKDGLTSQEQASTSTIDDKVETKDIVTPYAFGVADELLGKRLATPFQRGIAQVIDLVLVAILSSLNALFLALIAAFTFFKASRNLARKNHRDRTRKWLRFGGAVMLFWSTLLILNVAFEPELSQDTDGDGDIGVAAPILYGANLLAWTQCDSDMTCLSNLASDMGDAFAQDSMEEASFVAGLEEFLAGTALDDTQRDQIKAQYISAFQRARAQQAQESEQEIASTNAAGDSGTENASGEAQSNWDMSEIITEINKDEEPSPTSNYSVVEWIKGIIAELGLGFGWAALYYSVFTAWFNGKTPGKRLMNIRVLKLDGSALSLWDSFGRYGGYGAGLATGLLGFFQIYWDPNRQAIQDKISETLVISAVD